MSKTGGPDWKLDRRDSGRLFWRRDSKTDVTSSSPDSASSSSASPSKERVKFRYDVEVLEFWELDAADAAERSGRGDESGRGDGTHRVSNGPMRAKRYHAGQTQSVMACVACLVAIGGTMWYQWWTATRT